MASNSNGFILDEDTRHQEIIASLRAFLKHQTAFKEYMAKRMTPEEYGTICSIVTQGFVELSVEILALEAHLGGPNHTSVLNGSASSSSAAGAEVASPSSDSATTGSAIASPSGRHSVSLNSPEHAQLIRQVQLLEKQKLNLTVQGQKWAMEKLAQEERDLKEREAELHAERVVGENENENGGGVEGEVQAQAAQNSDTQGQEQREVRLSVEEWQTKLDENRDRLNELVEEINDKLADIQEAIAVLVL
ncbi:hypothetical protein BGZ99_005808 [Dissophora globulifera]|uniref:Uncharacterized protein n=1 Tax=Dissophora globulifera TaxID=979702 RepID=A0A9P6USU9_9FUNG|nr:hypothetical protein BGZ99_005808 [Dissophora globulifera]